jgi:starch phosphorylase
VVDQLIDGTYANGNRDMYRNLYNSLINTQSTNRADTYFVLKDFRSYAEAQKRVEEAYRDENRWSRIAMMNTACSGKFTSDRTIEEYVRDIWKLNKVYIPTEE